MSPSTTQRRGPSIAGWAPTIARSEYDEEELEFWTNREISLIQNLLQDRGELDKGTIGLVLLRVRLSSRSGVG